MQIPGGPKRPQTRGAPPRGRGQGQPKLPGQGSSSLPGRAEPMEPRNAVEEQARGLRPPQRE